MSGPTYTPLDQSSDSAEKDPELGKDPDLYIDPELAENNGPYTTKKCIGQVTFRWPTQDPLLIIAMIYGVIPWAVPFGFLAWYLASFRFMPLFCMALTAGAVITNEAILKPLLKQPRPEATGNRYPTATGKPSVRVKPGMPSGHTSSSTAILGWMALEIYFRGDAADPIPTEWLVFTLVCMLPTPWARWYNQDHTATQCAVGCVIGAFWAFGAFYLRTACYPGVSAPWNSHDGVENPTWQRPVHMIFDPVLGNQTLAFIDGRRLIDVINV